jgi:type IV pilus assembly protein PilE
MKRERGFTLLELMIVVAVVAILAAIAFPSFKEAIHKSHRAEATQTLNDIALRQEKYRSNNATYGTCNNVVTSCTAYNSGLSYYTIAVSGNTATAYSVTATPKGAQTGDRCGTYTYAMSNGTLSKSAASGQSNCL